MNVEQLVVASGWDILPRALLLLGVISYLGVDTGFWNPVAGMARGVAVQLWWLTPTTLLLAGLSCLVLDRSGGGAALLAGGAVAAALLAGRLRPTKPTSELQNAARQEAQRPRHVGVPADERRTPRLLACAAGIVALALALAA